MIERAVAGLWVLIFFPHWACAGDQDFIAKMMREDSGGKENWVLVGKSDSMAVYFNSSVNTLDDGFPVVWTKVKHTPAVKAIEYNVYAGVKVEYKLERILVDCEKSMFAPTNSAVYRPGGILLKSWIYPRGLDSFSPMTKNTVEDRAASFACKLNKK